MTADVREVWRAPAKINLYLEITGRRPDGYHEVDTCLQAIDLADTIVFEPADADQAVSCVVDGPWAEGIPTGDENLAVKAARALADHTGHDLRLALALSKQIPAGAGLGGGSSDAAAVLYALAQRFAVPDPEHTLHDLAAEIGADVPFFLHGGTQRALGIGDELEVVESPNERWGILAYPGVPVDTAWAYRTYAETRGADTDAGHSDWKDRGNVFEPIVFERYPEVARAVDVLADGSAVVTRMSGSGSGVFSLYPGAAERDADVVRVETVLGEETGASVWPFEFVSKGVHAVREADVATG